MNSLIFFFPTDMNDIEKNAFKEELYRSGQGSTYECSLAFGSDEDARLQALMVQV